MNKDSSKKEFMKNIYRWPTYPAPPTGTHRGGQLLLGVAYLTTAAIYVTFLADASNKLDLTAHIVISVLFALFALNIFLYVKVFEQFWKRLLVIIFQIVLISGIVFLGVEVDSLSILYFIIIPMIFLAFNFFLSSALLLLCLCTMFLSNMAAVGIKETLGDLLPYGGGFAFFAAVSLALVQQQKERQRAEYLLDELEQAHQKLRTYATQVEALAVAEERNRIARDIHDSLGHYLTAMTMQLQAAAKLVEINPQRAAAVIEKAENMARDSLAEVRRAVAALRASPVDTLPLNDAIKELAQNLIDNGIKTAFEIGGESQPLSIKVRTALYRAAQEGFTNVSKHANARSVTVRLTYKQEYAVLTIFDDGIGQQNKSEVGYGLIGLRERLNLLGGSLEAGNLPEGGFRLYVTVPYENKNTGQKNG